jgi:hypothetical protein
MKGTQQIMRDKDDYTTISIPKKLRAQLDKLGNIHEENYADIIQRLIQHYKIFMNVQTELSRGKDRRSKQIYDEIFKTLDKTLSKEDEEK